MAEPLFVAFFAVAAVSVSLLALVFYQLIWCRPRGIDRKFHVIQNCYNFQLPNESFVYEKLKKETPDDTYVRLLDLKPYECLYTFSSAIFWRFLLSASFAGMQGQWKLRLHCYVNIDGGYIGMVASYRISNNTKFSNDWDDALLL